MDGFRSAVECGVAEGAKNRQRRGSSRRHPRCCRSPVVGATAAEAVAERPDRHHSDSRGGNLIHGGVPVRRDLRFRRNRFGLVRSPGSKRQVGEVRHRRRCPRRRPGGSAALRPGGGGGRGRCERHRPGQGGDEEEVPWVLLLAGIPPAFVSGDAPRKMGRGLRRGYGLRRPAQGLGFGDLRWTRNSASVRRTCRGTGAAAPGRVTRARRRNPRGRRGRVGRAV